MRFINSNARGVGVFKQFVTWTVEDMLKPDFGLFTFSDDRNIYIKPKVDAITMEDINKYRQLGRLLALGVTLELSLGAYFTRGAVSFLAKFVHANVNMMEWCAEEDPVYANSLTTPSALIGLTFPDNDELEVTEENVNQYIEAMATDRVKKSIEVQMKALVHGVYEILPYGQLGWLSTNELMVLLGGVREISVDDLKASTINTINVDEGHQVIEWFWETVDDMTQEQLGDLLSFVSGSRYPPIDGFTGPRGDGQWLNIIVDRNTHLSSTITTTEDSIDFFPKAQTCFKQIKFGLYSSKEIMRERLLMALYSDTLENS